MTGPGQCSTGHPVTTRLSKTVSVSLDADVHARLCEVAERYRERPTDLIRRAVTQLLDYIDAAERNLAARVDSAQAVARHRMRAPRSRRGGR